MVEGREKEISSSNFKLFAFSTYTPMTLVFIISCSISEDVDSAKKLDSKKEIINIPKNINDNSFFVQFIIVLKSNDKIGYILTPKINIVFEYFGNSHPKFYKNSILPIV